jgi:hypothetical protein
MPAYDGGAPPYEIPPVPVAPPCDVPPEDVAGGAPEPPFVPPVPPCGGPPHPVPAGPPCATQASRMLVSWLVSVGKPFIGMGDDAS